MQTDNNDITTFGSEYKLESLGQETPIFYEN